MDQDNEEKKQPFRRIQEDLKSALDTWSEVSTKARGKKSPEEEQLEEIRKLLGDLQDKIKDFDHEA